MFYTFINYNQQHKIKYIMTSDLKKKIDENLELCEEIKDTMIDSTKKLIKDRHFNLTFLIDTHNDLNTEGFECNSLMKEILERDKCNDNNQIEIDKLLKRCHEVIQYVNQCLERKMIDIMVQESTIYEITN
jgi:hypothetical protein